jgi:hypothetical protein
MYIHGYTWYFHDEYTWISMYIPGISTPLDIHGISMDIMIHGYPRDIDEDGIYIWYTRNIPCIYMKLGFQMAGRGGRPDVGWRQAASGTAASLSSSTWTVP